MVQTWVNPNISADFIIVQFCILNVFEVINLKKNHLVYSFSNWCIINTIFIKSCFFNYFIQMPIAVASNYLFSINSVLCFKENSKMSWVSKRKQFAVMFDVNSFSQGVYIDTIFYCCKRFKIKHFSKKILFFFSFLLFFFKLCGVWSEAFK